MRRLLPGWLMACSLAAAPLAAQAPDPGDLAEFLPEGMFELSDLAIFKGTGGGVTAVATTTLMNVPAHVLATMGPGSGAAWGNEVVFLLLNIIPVYGVCAGLVDALVLNSIEFWTGDNPMASVTVTKLDDTRDMRLEKIAENQVKVEIIENGVVLGTYTVDRTDTGSVLHDAAGNEVAATSIGLDGQLELVAAR